MALSFNRFVLSILSKSWIIIFSTIIITVFMAWQATKIHIDTNFNKLMPQDNERITKIRETLGINNETTDFLIVSIQDHNLFDLEILQIFKDTIDRITAFPEVDKALTPFNFIYFDTKGKRIIPTTISKSGQAPHNQDELQRFKERIESGGLAKNFVVADDGKILTAIFNLKTMDNPEEFVKKFYSTILPLQKIVKVYETGETLFQQRVGFYLLKDFKLLLILALIAMLTVFWISFRSLRAVFLPIFVVSIGVIWTLGFMSMIGFSITVITVIIPTLVLAIGSSYTIHIISEYLRNTVDEIVDLRQWLADTVEHVIRTVILAALTTMFSFLSLLTTTIRPLQEFGLSIGVGIFVCAVLSLFFLPAVLMLTRLPKPKLRRIKKNDIVSRIIIVVGQWSSRHYLIVSSSFLVLLFAFILTYPNITHQSDYFSYFPSDDPVIVGARFVNENSGGPQSFHITITSANNQKNFFLDPKILSTIDQFETIVSGHPAVTSRVSFISILKEMNKAVSGKAVLPSSRGLILLLYRYFGLIPKDKVIFGQDSSIINDEASQMTIYLRLSEVDTYNMINEEGMKDFLKFVEEEIDVYFDDSIKTTIWGNTLLVLDSSYTIKRDQMRSTILSILIGMIVIFMFFKSLPYIFLALIPLFSGIFVYFITLYVFNIPLDLTTIIVTNVTVGVGLDDAIHFILRYRIQRKNQPMDLALTDSLRITGRPIVLTTISLVAGLLVLCFGSFKPVVFFGILITSTLISTMIGTVVLIPAFINVFEAIKARINTKLR